MIHTYYTVALAPAIAALVAIGAVSLWRDRESLSARLWLSCGVAVSAGWSWVLLDRTPGWQPWLRPLIGVSAALAIVCLLALAVPRRLSGRALELGAVLAAVCCLAGPVAYTAQTLSTAHTGSIPSAGPSSALTAGGGGPGGFAGGARPGGFGGASAPAAWRRRAPRRGRRAAARPGAGSGRRRAGASVAELFGGAGATGGRPPGASGGGFGVGGQTTTSAALVKALEAEPGHYRWVAAVSGSQAAASLELATGGDPVMAIGGFNGQGGNLSLARFKQYVAAGEIHYYIASAGAGGGPGGQRASSSAISSWVEAHFKTETIGGQTVYDLTQTKA